VTPLTEALPSELDREQDILQSPAVAPVITILPEVGLKTDATIASPFDNSQSESANADVPEESIYTEGSALPMQIETELTPADLDTDAAANPDSMDPTSMEIASEPELQVATTAGVGDAHSQPDVTNVTQNPTQFAADMDVAENPDAMDPTSTEIASDPEHQIATTAGGSDAQSQPDVTNVTENPTQSAADATVSMQNEGQSMIQEKQVETEPVIGDSVLKESAPVEQALEESAPMMESATEEQVDGVSFSGD
jgi:hypothetical protein